MAKKKQLSRYERFKRILTDANGDSRADYQGYHDFWNKLSLEDLQKLILFGVPMFAPKENIEEEVSQESTLGSYTDDHPSKKSSSKSHSASTPSKKSSNSGSSCCGSSKDDSCETSSSSSPSDGPKYPDRGKDSGIIKFLKGEYPFDGSMFPRFPFHSADDDCGDPKNEPHYVSASDIDMISGWIDDGCPASDEPEKPSDKPPHYDGTIIHPPHQDPNKVYHDSNGLKQRKNYQYIKPEELQRLRLAYRKTFDLNEYPLDIRNYNSWAKTHGDSCQHGWEQFLPWHRAYLYEFELLLQDFVPNVTLPYWNWTQPEYKQGIPQAPAKGSKQLMNGIIPPAYRCWLSPDNLKTLAAFVEANPEKSGEIKPSDFDKVKSFTDTLFNSGVEVRWVIEDKIKKKITNDLYAEMAKLMKDNNPIWHDSRYPGMFFNTVKGGQGYVMDKKTGRPALAYNDQMAGHFHHFYPKKDEIDAILDIPRWRDFGGGHYANQSFGELSQNPHNIGHIWSGGENPYYDFKLGPTATNSQYGSMFNDLVAFYDPIAWGHHSNVDRMWYLWQEKHPDAKLDDMTAVMMPWHYTVQDLMDVHKLGYEYVMDSQYYGVHNDVPVTKLNTHDSGVHEDILKGHKKVEIRLHGVRRAVNSHIIKVFLNSPDANHETPVRENDNFVGYAARFGHGNCVGGPGHCDVPDINRHFFDRRHRHHNTPTNHTFDATEQVRKLLKAGAKDINVNMVVTGGNSKLAEGNTRALIDGISVHFFD